MTNSNFVHNWARHDPDDGVGENDEEETNTFEIKRIQIWQMKVTITLQKRLNEIKVDGAIISDGGIVEIFKKYAPIKKICTFFYTDL